MAPTPAHSSIDPTNDVPQHYIPFGLDVRLGRWTLGAVPQLPCDHPVARFCGHPLVYDLVLSTPLLHLTTPRAVGRGPLGL